MQDVDETTGAPSNDDEKPLSTADEQLCDPRLVTVDLNDISTRYRDICPLGCGSRALIFSAIDQQCRRRLAVKKVSLKQCTSSHTLKQLLREIRILRRMDHDNVVRIHHALASTNSRESSSPVNVTPNHLSTKTEVPLDSVYIGMELMDTDLRSVIEHNQLSPSYVKLFMYQLLRGLKYMHSANVIHRDLTPSNVFINIDTLMLKIGDFGISRILDSDYEHSGYLSMATTSTWYQSPEILLHPRHYDQYADMWAAGCIFAEMLSGKPLFPGSNAMEQIDTIVRSVALTTESWCSVTNPCCSNPNCCPSGEVYGVRGNGGIPSQPLRDMLPHTNRMAINLLSQLLTFSPKDRVSAVDALIHPYLDCYGMVNDEPSCLAPFRLEDELDGISLVEMQQMLWNETANICSVPSSESNAVETSTEECGLRQSLKGSVCANDSYKNLLALVHSSNPSNGNANNGGITISESEARTIACDFDYGVQINDGSVNRERMSIDFRPTTASAACFDPYKWDSRCGNTTPQPQSAITEEPTKSHPSDGHQEVVSDHGYHSSYCSSNLSHGKAHPHSLWSLSSPDVSIDHDRASGHRASTPDLGEVTSPTGLDSEDHQSDFSRHSPTFSSEEKEHTEVTTTSRRRHKDDVPRHHQSYGLHYHHHHHHHHGHHHHHKHHRHSSRHGSLSSASNSASHQQTSSNEADPSSARCHQRRCVVNDTVPEVSEEQGVDVGGSDRLRSKEGPERKSSSSDSDSKTARKKPCKFTTKLCRARAKALPSAGLEAPVSADSGYHEPSIISPLDSANKSGSIDAIPAKLERPKATRRVRTWSDGNRSKSGGFVSGMSFPVDWKKLIHTATCSDKSPFLHCQSVSILDRIGTFSGVKAVAASDVTGRDVSPSPPSKCSASGTPNFPRRRVECPF